MSIADSVRLLDMGFPVHGNHKIGRRRNDARSGGEPGRCLGVTGGFAGSTQRGCGRNTVSYVVGRRGIGITCEKWYDNGSFGKTLDQSLANRERYS